MWAQGVFGGMVTLQYHPLFCIGAFVQEPDPGHSRASAGAACPAAFSVSCCHFSSPSPQLMTGSKFDHFLQEIL